MVETVTDVTDTFEELFATQSASMGQQHLDGFVSTFH